MGLSLSIAVATANGLAMVRVLTGISILWFLVPGYAVALAMMFCLSITGKAVFSYSGLKVTVMVALS